MTDANSLLEKIRLQNRTHQKTFYAKNKDAVNARRRELYKAGRNALNGIVPGALEQIHEHEPLEQIKEPEPLQPVKQVKAKKSNTIINYEDAILKLKDRNLATATYNKYKDDLKRLVEITGCQDIFKCLKKHKQIIKDVNNSKKKNGEPYSNNTIKGIYQSILYVIDNLNLNVDKKPYLHEFEIRKITSVDDNKNKIENEIVLPFKDYISKVREKFGEDSKMFIIASLYDELTVRDDFALKIISNHKDATDDKINYLLVPKLMACKITINTYKTDKKYGVIKHTCSKPLSNAIKKYIAENGLKVGDYLFGNKPLTQFVSSNNPKIGIQGGVNLFRHMKITDELKSVKTPEERKELADKMRHSPVTQLAYLRKHKLI